MSDIYTGISNLQVKKKRTEGCFVNFDKERYYKISNYDQMPDFFMSIVSAYDHWLYISSNGALTAGRKNKEQALFPYYTVDKIHDSQEITGSKTIIITEKNGKNFLWEPFSSKYEHIYNTERNIYKNLFGNVLMFEEINKDLNLVFRYKWQTGNRFGFIRTSELLNVSKSSQKINVLDGLQNILPALLNSNLQTNYSNLVDAYKKNELTENGTGLYYLSSVPTDKAEPGEGLKATTVWSFGHQDAKILLSSKQLNCFRKTGKINPEKNVRAERGAFLINTKFDLDTDEKKFWHIIADVNQNLKNIFEIEHFQKNEIDINRILEEDINKNTLKLKKIIGKADGLQLTADELSTTRHISNVLFNTMRGGVIDDPGGIDSGNFRCHIDNMNKDVFQKQQNFLNALPDFISFYELLNKAKNTLDRDLIRLTYEYLPLTFSRRHGDPSRPWNEFSINLEDENGGNLYCYEGNWRDIFQNWEALAISFPEYIESMIVKFMNASTVDGYNPYRISEKGVDWEVIEPDNPWSNIGYWGDHQIIYLLKLLELSEKYHPENLFHMLDEEIFVFANVPFRIKSYEEIYRNPYDTIHFSFTTHNNVLSACKTKGADGKLVTTSEDKILKVTLFEKLLLTLFTKLSNFIPEAGIWLNTQRPEWNDANNAMVGHGASMVTLYYLRRYVLFLRKMLQKIGDKEFVLTKELTQFLNELKIGFIKFSGKLNEDFSDEDRKSFTDAVGQAGSTYRKLVYGKHSGIKEHCHTKNISDFLNLIVKYIEHSIKKNKRPDNLYQSYNLLKFDPNKNTIHIDNLYEMLEGQVAVLSSGFLSAEESVLLLDALKNSKLFRQDQYSFLLYPNRELKKFTEKNCIPESFSVRSELINLSDKNNDNSLIIKDRKGIFHFNGNFRNAKDVKNALEKLSNENYTAAVAKEKDSILDLWEDMFKHKEFTGRSGTFFAYEGLGSIYWHMVSKLLLAVGETYINAFHTNADKTHLGKLVEHYYEIRAGIGLNKSPDVFGAFPIDPYSHTPANSGAKQPGMTGQVKEDIISRFIELGVYINQGRIEFNPVLLRRSEFLNAEHKYSYFSLSGNKEKIQLNKGELAFTFCGIPVVYHLSETEKSEVIYYNKTVHFEGLKLDENTSVSVFNRERKILRINVFLNLKLI